MEFLYLSEEQMIKAGVKDMHRCIDSMEEMFRILKIGDYRMGGINNNSHGLRVQFPKTSDIEGMPLDAPGRWFTAMPSYLGGKYHVFGIKTYGANQDNVKKGLPRSVLMMSLMDVETGVPISYMSANILSAMRTGAVSGVAAKYLSVNNPQKIAIIGPGTMARYSLDAIMCVYNSIKEMSVLGIDEQDGQRFLNYCQNKNYVFEKSLICCDEKEVCENADIIITANSQSENFEDYPIIKENYLKPGALVIVVSAIRFEKKFVDDENVCTCFADDVRQYEEKRTIDAISKNDDTSITFKNALHDRIINNRPVLSIYDVIDNPEFKRDLNKIYVFASGGIPLEDVAWGYECYQNALKNHIGITLPIWENSEL